MTLYLTPTDPDGTDCETCGWSPDDCEIDYEGDGKWMLRGRWGCYGGDSFEGTREELIEYLRDWDWDHLFTKDSIKGAIRALEEA